MEEDIKILKNLIEYLQLKIDSGEHKIIYNNLMCDEKIVDCINSIENIITTNKLLKRENEEVLQEKINNQKVIALANNNMLNYQAGFEDGKNSRTSAVQSIIENQQYYIFQRQIEKYKEHIEKLQKENEKKEKIIDLMTRHITDGSVMKTYKVNCVDCIKQYFKKVSDGE